MYPIRILVTLITLIAMGGIFITVLILTEHVSVETTPLIVTVLGFIGLIINNLVTGQKIVNKVDETSDKLDRVLNGEMDDKIAKVVRRQLHIYFTGEDAPPLDKPHR